MFTEIPSPFFVCNPNTVIMMIYNQEEADNDVFSGGMKKTNFLLSVYLHVFRFGKR